MRLRISSTNLSVEETFSFAHFVTPGVANPSPNPKLTKLIPAATNLLPVISSIFLTPELLFSSSSHSNFKLFSLIRGEIYERF